jgi:hypothetical protein
MKPERLLVLSSFARGLRNVASLGVVVLGVRFAWLALGDSATALAAGEAEAPGAVPRREPGRRLDVKSVTDRLKDEVQQDLPLQVPSPKKPELRRLLVDLGPERSEVFIDGHLVGRTPYVGQASCIEGAQLRIEVLPPSGAPITRKAECRGSTIVAAH